MDSEFLNRTQKQGSHSGDPPEKDSAHGSDVPGAANLEYIIKSKDSMIKKFEYEIKVLASKLKSSYEENKTLREKIAELDISKSIEIMDLKHETDLLTTEKHALLSENEAMLESISNKERAIKDLKRAIEIKSLQLDEAQKDLLSAASTVRELKTKNDDFEMKLGTFEERAAPSDLNSMLDERGRELDEQLRAEVKQVLELKDRGMEEIKSNYENELDKGAELESEIKALIAERTTLESEVIGARKELEVFSHEKDGLKRDLEDRQGRITFLEEAVSSKETTIAELNERLSEQAGRTETLDSEKEGLADKLKEAEDEIFTLREALSSELNGMRKKLEDEEHLREEIKQALELKDRGMEEIKSNYEDELLKKMKVFASEKEQLVLRLKEAVVEIASNKEALSGEMGGLRERLETGQRLRAEAEDALQLKGRELAEIKSRYRDEVNKGIALEADVERLNEEKAELVKRLDAEKEKMPTEALEETAVPEAEEEIISLREALSAEISGIREKFEEEGRIRAQIEYELEKRNAEIDELKYRYESELRQRMELEPGINELKEELNASAKIISELEERISAIKPIPEITAPEITAPEITAPEITADETGKYEEPAATDEQPDSEPAHIITDFEAPAVETSEVSGEDVKMDVFEGQTSESYPSAPVGRTTSHVYISPEKKSVKKAAILIIVAVLLIALGMIGIYIQKMYKPVSFKSFVSIGRNYNIQGAVIRGLKDGPPLIIK